MGKRKRHRNDDNDSIIEVDSSTSSDENSSSCSSEDEEDVEDYKKIKKEVFIWVDSELKDIYVIDNKLKWSEQKPDIITKLLPPLYKLVNKKYDVTNSDILKMLYGRWRSRHRVNNISIQGEDQVKKNKRRASKNTRMQDKKKRRTHAADYLLKGNNEYIRKYPEKDLVQILKNSGYHSEEWEETDPEQDWFIIEEEVKEDNIVTKEAVKKKTTSLYVYERWWRSQALRHLLHDRIDPTVELLRKQPPNFKRKRVQNNKNDEAPPIGTPDWCLNIEALEKLGRSNGHIPNYDSDDIEDRHANNSDRDDSESGKSRKEKKKKRRKKVNKHKTKKSKKK